MIKEKYTIKDLFPLFGMFGIVILYTASVSIYYAAWRDMFFVMRQFMGGFFLLFGLLKVINWDEFAKAYVLYDVIAMRSKFYAYLYPLIEVVLGVMYILGLYLLTINWVTLGVMTISAVGVGIKLAQRERIMCACLGAVFKVPMTWVTLTEDLLMAVMAGYMIYLIG